MILCPPGAFHGRSLREPPQWGTTPPFLSLEGEDKGEGVNIWDLSCMVDDLVLSSL